MKTSIWIVLLIVLSGCVSTSESAAFRFYDAHGEEYNSLTAPSNFKKEFNLDTRPKMVVVAISSSSNPKYKEQIDVIGKVNAEEMEYLYIIANSEEEQSQGYYMTREDSANILEGTTFKIIIFDGLSKVVKNSNQIIGINEFRNYLTK